MSRESWKPIQARYSEGQLAIAIAIAFVVGSFFGGVLTGIIAWGNP